MRARGGTLVLPGEIKNKILEEIPLSQPILPCGSRPTPHPAHLPIDALASGNRLRRSPVFVATNDTHRQCSAPPAPPTAPYRSCSSPPLPRASSSRHTPPASKCIPDPIPASCTPDQKSPRAHSRSARPSSSHP